MYEIYGIGLGETPFVRRDCAFWGVGGVSRSVEWQFLTDILGQPIGPMFSDCLALEDGTDR